MFISERFTKWTHARNHHLEQGLERAQAPQQPLLPTPSNCPPARTVLLTFATDCFGTLWTWCKWNKVICVLSFLILSFSVMFVSSIHIVSWSLFIVICCLVNQHMNGYTINGFFLLFGGTWVSSFCKCCPEYPCLFHFPFLVQLCKQFY